MTFCTLLCVYKVLNRIKHSFTLDINTPRLCVCVQLYWLHIHRCTTLNKPYIFTFSVSYDVRPNGWFW